MPELKQLSFEHLWILTLLILPLSLYIYASFSRRFLYKSRVIKTQCLLLGICIVASANPLIQSEKKTAQVSIAVDFSDSMDYAASREMYQEALKLTAGNSDVSNIIFAGTHKTLNSANSIESLLREKTGLLTNATNLESAISEASGLSKNIILISDGHQNRGNVFNIANATGAKIFPLVPEGVSESRQSALNLLSVEHPLIVDPKKSAEIKIGLYNSGSVSSKGKLKIYEDDQEIFNRDIEVGGNQGISIEAKTKSDKSGIRKIRAILIADNSEQQKTSFISTKSAEKVLLLNGSAEDGQLLFQAFDGRSYVLVTSLAANQISGIQDYSVIILNNIANKQLPEGLLNNLGQYVRNGGALVTIGGNKAYGLGGYIGTNLEELLPVKLSPPKGQEKRLTVAVSLIIDKSRSMADSQKLEFSKEAAREVVRNLKDEDYVGVIGFDSSPFEVVRMGQLAQIRSQAMERIGRLFPAQKTNLFPAMDEGRRRLQSVQTGRKHMIVLTDGKIPDADQSYIELVKEMRLNGITLSTVLVGTDYDFGFLKQMAEKGGGAFYQTSDPSSLPRIFLQDVKVRSGEQSLKEQSNYDIKTGEDGLISTSIENYPELLGFVETKFRENAKSELVVESQNELFPMLSSWQVGNGKVISFTSDANGRWSRAWASWSKFVTFWTDILDTARGHKQKDSIKYDLRTEIEGDQVVLELTTFEQTAGTIESTLESSGGQKESLKFSKIREGIYRSKIPVNEFSGTYTFSGKIGNNKLTPVSFALDPQQFAEKTGQGFNIKVLSELASLSNGRINPSIEDLTATSINKTNYQSIRYELLIFGLFLYFLSILIREVAERPFFSRSKVKGIAN